VLVCWISTSLLWRRHVAEGDTVGSGLVSLTAARCGAKCVTITDYPSPALISTIRTNVESNFPSHEYEISVEPNKWGGRETQFGVFTRVVASDCLWMANEHDNLVKSMLYVLSNDKTEEARVWVVAGFHTGRDIVRDFLDTAVREGLAIERIWERNSKTGDEREWVREREGEGVGERKAWCVVAVLRRG
jgi:hypothetical protein